MGYLKQILIADDFELDRVILRETLSDEYEILEACNGQEALDILSTSYRNIAAIILDIMMPVIDGYELMKIIKNTPNFSKIPIIVSTANDDIESKLKSLDLDAQDIIEKPIEPLITKNRIENIILKSQLEYYYTYDNLTGMYNERAFNELVHTLLINNKNEQYVIIRFDVEQFKIINDLFGLDEGDKILKFIADKIKHFTDENGICSRINADIFAICAKHSISKNKELVDNITLALKDYPLNFKILPCFGLYIVDNPDINVNHMLDCANLASKTVKESFLKRYAYYDEGLRSSLINKYEIINDMNTALTEKQFVIYLQPKYNVALKKIEGSEALVRWIHPTKGLISPGNFIPIFEQNGFILKLDAYVLEETCKLIRKWIDSKYITPLPVSVNLSRMNLYNTNLCNDIIRIVEQYDIPTELIELEITESAYTNNASQLIDTMTCLQNYGFKILMDDFGSGYSSLNMLKDIPVDTLKIDLKFLSDSDKNHRGNNILKSVVIMANSLHLETIAEGVETKDQLDFLHNIGCNSIQGYYYSKPLPVPEYESLVLHPKIID